MSGRVFFFAGGGTGGHLFPALAIAEQLRALAGGADVRSLFLCSDRPLDAEILRRERVEFDVIPARPFSVRPLALAKFLASWRGGVRATRAVIRRERTEARDVELVAMGGFVAAPAVRGAAAERCPVTMVNMDAVPGRANRWIAGRARRVLTSAPVPSRPEWTSVPPIVRASAMAGASRAESRRALGLDPGRATLLVTGASQGARSINRMMVHLVGARAELLRGWQVVHQTGLGEDGPTRAAYVTAGVPAVVEPFFTDMGAAWGAADLAVSRAGAGSVAEAWANRVPTVFMPYPYHRDQHQRFNAAPLADAGAAVIVDDLIDPVANAYSAGEKLGELLASERLRAAMRGALERLGPADGARRIAAALLGRA